MKFPVVKNARELGTTRLRKDALTILEAGYEAIDTKRVISTRVTLEKDTLHIDERTFNLASYERVFFVGIGKCAADAAEEFERILSDRITDGVVIDVRGAVVKHMKARAGTHPLPSEKNRAAAQEVATLLAGATKNDLVIAVISGGGSALLCLPHDMKCEELSRITRLLMEQGANIHEINTVRKHTSEIQGGQFAKLAFPAEVCALIFSDVPGDDMSMIASGPTVRDTTTQKDADEILATYDVVKSCRLDGCGTIETPKDEKYFARVTNILFVTNKTALVAMKEKAEALSYRAQIADTHIEGEARVLGKTLAARAREARTCLLYGGESTVTVKGKGKGGRNQELALGALPYLSDDMVLVAASSDGWDNTDAAGALVDHGLYTDAQEKSFDPKTFLNDNNAYEFFRALSDGHIYTERTGANVSDFYFTLKG